ncbi:unnamed protein product, partial [Rotaria sordida]
MSDDRFLSELAQDIDIFDGALLRLNDDDFDDSIFDDKLDDQLAMQDKIDGEWEHLMTAGPLVVNYVANLLVLASKRDFPLSRPPFFAFQHITDPNSFRATLSQVVGAMYSALIGAHTAMDRIQLNVQQVPGHQQIAEQQKLAAIINRIAALDLDRLSEQEIVDILIEAILQMNQIKEQWSRLIQFFSKLSVQADSTQQIVIHEFIAAIKEAQANNLLLDPSDRELFVELLTITSQEIERGAHLLYVMSKTYFDVSSEYMINQITASGNLLLLQTDTERSTYLRSLSQNTTSISRRVTSLAQERHQEYTTRNQARRAEYERFLAQLALEDLEENDTNRCKELEFLIENRLDLRLLSNDTITLVFQDSDVNANLEFILSTILIDGKTERQGGIFIVQIKLNENQQRNNLAWKGNIDQ